MTQWVFATETCSCSSGNSTSGSQSPRCALCSLPIKTRIGSLTQWIFKTGTCACLEQTKENQLQTDELPSDDLVAGAPYHFVGVTGSGGAATVYKAVHQKLNRPVAVKILHDDVGGKKAARDFEREAKSASKLQHPNLLTVQDFGVMSDGRQYLVTEWVDGLTLAEYLSKKGRVPVPVARELFSQVLDGLTHAHNRNVVHRDIKPSNIMLTHNSGGGWSIKIIDFGTAKEIERDGATTRAGDLACSPSYMSPEHANGDPVDHRSDLYSVGCSLFEALTGRPPFIGKTLSVVMQHQLEAPPTLEEASGGSTYPASIEAVVQQLLQKNPQHRFQTAHEAKLALTGRVPVHSINADNAKNTAEPGEMRRAKLNQRAALVGAICALVVCLCGAFYVYPALFSHSNVNATGESTATQKLAVKPIQLYERANITDNSWRNNSLDWFKIPEGVALSKLPAIEVSGLILKRHVDDADWMDIARIKRLRSIHLVNQTFSPSSIDALKQLTHLESMVLVDCSISNGMFGQLKSLPNFNRIIINNCEVAEQDVLDISELSNINYLNLSDSKVVSTEKCMTAIGRMTLLRWLIVSHCDVTDNGLLQLCKLPRLESLTVELSNLSENAFKVPRWKKLKILNISFTKSITDVTIEQIAANTKLHNLNLQGDVGVTDKCIPHLTKMQYLSVVDLSGTMVTKRGAEALKKNRPRLRVRMSADLEGVDELWLK